MGITIRKAKRINELPPYLFAEIDRRKREALARGVDLIDLGIGDPDIPTPSAVIERLIESASKPVNHRYPSSSGLAEFRQAVADWYQKRFNVKLDPGKEIVSLIGSKEGIGNMAVAFVNPGDVVLVASPCYPVYHIGTAFNGGKNYFLPLKKENHFLPELDSIPACRPRWPSVSPGFRDSDREKCRLKSSVDIRPCADHRLPRRDTRQLL